jgi:hypothetical protein
MGCACGAYRLVYLRESYGSPLEEELSWGIDHGDKQKAIGELSGTRTRNQDENGQRRLCLRAVADAAAKRRAARGEELGPGDCRRTTTHCCCPVVLHRPAAHRAGWSSRRNCCHWDRASPLQSPRRGGGGAGAYESSVRLGSTSPSFRRKDDSRLAAQRTSIACCCPPHLIPVAASRCCSARRPARTAMRPSCSCCFGDDYGCRPGTRDSRCWELPM